MVALAVILGLLGFVQPCVVGVNSIFLSYLRDVDAASRAKELLKYVLVKTLFAALVGLVVSVVGAFLLAGVPIVFLRALLVLLGSIYIASRFRAMPVPNIVPRGNFSRGVMYGLSIPACAVPMFISLGAVAAFSGDILKGTILLGAFGAVIALPLLPIGMSERRGELMKKAAKVTGVSPVVAGSVLIAAGLLYPF